MRLKLLPTDTMSSRLRKAAIDTGTKRLLITSFTGSKQEKDLTEPANCGGLGRIRHFRRSTTAGWPSNGLPIDPAARALGLPEPTIMQAQVFQNAVCNWRCWYCFVDFDLLIASPSRSQWVTADELVDRYLQMSARPLMIDLTGGQPDLTPEWVLWMMEELASRGLTESVYVWSDDNLSNDYFFRFLSDEQRQFISAYPMYGRVCCFKGFNAESFSFNTTAEPALYDEQFALFSRLLDLGLDLYAYVTLTTPRPDRIGHDVADFVDRLQAIDRNLPLRTVPLEIRVFSPVEPRMNAERTDALRYQWEAIRAWKSEIQQRFSAREREVNIADVPLRGIARRQASSNASRIALNRRRPASP